MLSSKLMVGARCDFAKVIGHEAQAIPLRSAHIATTPDEDGKLIKELRDALGERASPDGGNHIGRGPRCVRASSG